MGSTNFLQGFICQGGKHIEPTTIERVAAEQLQSLLDDTSALDPLQSGFRPSSSTEMALVFLGDYICLPMDNSCAPLLLLSDLSRASDAVNHLSYQALYGRYPKMDYSFLKNVSHVQRIMAGDSELATQVLSCRAPSDSVLYPNTFQYMCKSIGSQPVVHQYGDDTQALCFPIKATRGCHRCPGAEPVSCGQLGPNYTFLTSWVQVSRIPHMEQQK